MATQRQKYNKLAGKHVLIIGGTSGTPSPFPSLLLLFTPYPPRQPKLTTRKGIGYGVAEALIESSADITISSSSPDRVKSSIVSLQKSYPNIKTKISGYACDLSKPSLEQDLEALFEKTGKVDHIVFTAGDRLATIPLAESTYESIIKAGQVRFFAPLLVAKVGRKYLSPSPQSSVILTTGSVADHPMPNWSVVASYAAGLHGMTRNLALDLKPIRVNLVSPGAIDTELWKHMSEEQKGEMFTGISAKAPTGKVGMPEDVAEAYLWLMKDSNVTGIVAYSDSGAGLV
ncbi:related to enoyl-[acyl-carrier-protein] reductase 1 [Phialocephala subalpina]|uniref:Related to enoyl-[acyl-carrier-protein] reductase 1 n=1 Tax=Phialocephala subalpina TaxID=576137 RepID=A0A1L7XFC7_9HELO|nr:related to enoyl-[acyl-carrier-protein] reductase 1 [Phialocephala subalpina]